MTEKGDKPQSWEEVAPKEPGGERAGIAVVVLLAAAALLIWWNGQGGDGSSVLSTPVAVQGGHSMKEGVLLRLSPPAEGRSWRVRFRAEAGPLAERDGLTGRLELERTVEARPAEATAEGEVGISFTTGDTSLAVQMWDEVDTEPQDALVMARLMSGFDPEAALAAADGIPMTYSMSDRGGLRDVDGWPEVLGAVVAALELSELLGGLLGDDLDFAEGAMDVRAALDEAREGLAEEGLLEALPFLDGPLPENPVDMDTRIGFTSRDLAMLLGGGEDSVEELTDDLPDLTWELVPVGLRRGAVVFEIVVAASWEAPGEEGGIVATGGGEAEIEISTGLPRRVHWDLTVDLAVDLGPEMEVDTPLTLSYDLAPA